MKIKIALIAFLGINFLANAQNNICKTKIRTEYPSEINLTQVEDVNQVFSVPVIFHVLYNNKRQNVPDSLILGLLETLHDDFLNQNIDINDVPTDFKPLIGLPNVNFYRATILPNAQPTDGIIRKHTTIKGFKYKNRDMFNESVIIDNKKYLNVYICSLNTNAFTPSENNPLHDGVVIDYSRVFKGSRTLTHEAGHWFDLRHIFEGECSDNDNVADTPAQKMHFQCPKHPHIDCKKPAMFMNYMDYSSCRYFFTVDQVDRMRKYIIKYKQF